MSSNSNTLVYHNYANKSVDETLIDLQSSVEEGLSEDEVGRRILKYGTNLIKTDVVRWWHILLRQFKSPFVYLLLSAIVLAWILGEYRDGLMILFFVLINSALGFFQEHRSEQAVKALKKYTVSHASVIRDGSEVAIEVSQLVPGDVVKLRPGDIVPADLRLIEVQGFMVDESVISGESEPVAKKIIKVDVSQNSIHECFNIAFSGTHIVSGQGIGVVVASGVYTYIGSIVKFTTETTHVSSFEKGMNRFSKFVLQLVGVTLMLIMIANLSIKGGEVDLINLVIFSIALATAVVPEALPLVITFSLSRGALRLAKSKVVVKRLSAIEDLGGIEILCTDKTGTITENQLTVVDMLTKNMQLLLRQAMATVARHNGSHVEPFDMAIEDFCAKSKFDKLQLDDELLNELPFDPERRRNSILLKQKKLYNFLVVRGATEAVVPFLKKKLSTTEHDWIANQGKQGKRVIVLASKEVDSSAKYVKSLEENDLIFTGAIAFIDPLKKSAVEAVQKAKHLGVVIKIVTGDSPAVAGYTGYQVGLSTSAEEVITADDFFALSIVKQKQMADKLNVFARFAPHQKHRLLEILQQKYEVGFLGEGINDAPALKSANVALVVKGASDIARSVADVILLNPSLNVIIDGVQEGRKVFANTIKYVKMTLASNFGNFFAVAIASLLVDYLPMLPIQILLVNLLSDFPLVAVASDSVDKDEIKNPESYSLREFAMVAVVFGLISSVFDFIFFGIFFRTTPEILRTAWFIGSVLTELVLLYSLRTKKLFYRGKVPSMAILIFTGMAALLTVGIASSKLGSEIFGFVPLIADYWLIIFGLVILYFVTTEVVKVVYYRTIGNIDMLSGKS